MMAPLRERSARALQWLVAAAACATLAACGGGGGGGNSTPTTQAPAASVSLSATPTTVNVGQSLTLSWSAQNTGADNCQASGAWSGQQALSGNATVTAAAPAGGFGNAASASVGYNLTCGATSASASVTVNAPAVSNQVDVAVDAGPAGAGSQINLPYVSVTVCAPGTNSCQTIDHVLVDTASYGLRLLAPQVQALALPAVLAPSGAASGECGQFISGYTWGSVVKADLKLGGETASALPLQLIGDAPGGMAAAPTACTNIGSNIGTLKALGANGILGIGLLRQDCGGACVNTAVAAAYYSCANGSCVASRMPLAQQVSNPVASFAVDNNGVLLQLPAVPAGGLTGIAGKLVFGINTASNNAIGSETTFRANGAANFTTIYKGVTMSASFLDSGSNGIFFNDSSIAECQTSKGFYCPPTTLALSATTVSADGTASRSIDFSLENVEALGASIHAANVGGPSGAVRNGTNNAFDWGLPFFFGRRVFVGMENGGTRGYWAY